ncbi:MAG: hypothetical protein HY906_27920 [Deltaproteobacteria bacterium]|nr:hypothetical protein [Deltaproteobacteria bacterium]
MTPLDHDDEIRQALKKAHHDDARGAPPFHALWPARRARASRARPLLALAAAVAVAAVTVLLLTGHPPDRTNLVPTVLAPTADAGPQAAALSALGAPGDLRLPTDFLLQTPSRGVLTDLPRLGTVAPDYAGGAGAEPTKGLVP